MGYSDATAGLFGNGWEENIVLTVNVDGSFSIWTEKDGANVYLVPGN